jgi:hypothetical protein
MKLIRPKKKQEKPKRKLIRIEKPKKLIRIKKTKLVRPKKKKLIRRTGRWCDEVSGRLPFPIECQWWKEVPLSCDHPHCKKCSRGIPYELWRAGHFKEISNQIKRGKDFRQRDVSHLVKQKHVQ